MQVYKLVMVRGSGFEVKDVARYETTNAAAFLEKVRQLRAAGYETTSDHKEYVNMLRGMAARRNRELSGVTPSAWVNNDPKYVHKASGK